MKSSFIKTLLFCLALVVTLFIGWNDGISKAEAEAMGSCGSGMECYSVPDGCGEGVGCIRTTCDSFTCPQRDLDYPEEFCFYCAEVGEN